MQNLACSQHQIHTQCIHVSSHKLKVPKDIHTINLPLPTTPIFFVLRHLCVCTHSQKPKQNKNSVICGIADISTCSMCFCFCFLCVCFSVLTL